jgi:hypothetical protein
VPDPTAKVRRIGARARLRTYFRQNVGRVLTNKELAEAAGSVTEWARRVRELRSQEGMDIQTHNDRTDLRPGEYMLVSLEPRPAFSAIVPPAQRVRILHRNGMTCQLCGAGAGELDPYDPSKRVRLHVDHIVPVSEGGTSEDDNLRALCSACNEGRSNLQIRPSERALNVLGVVRRAPKDVQEQVYRFLRRKFERAPATRGRDSSPRSG